MVTKRVYFTILIMFVTVFCLFMYIGVSNNLVANKTINGHINENIEIKYEDTLSSDSLNIETNSIINDIEKKMTVAIISQDEDRVVTNILIEWCVYSKLLYKTYTSLPNNEEIEGYDVILFGDLTFTKEDCEMLYSYADMSNTMIFTQPPDFQLLNYDKQLTDFFGIEEVKNNSVDVDGIKIFSDFMIGGERIYQKDDYFGLENDTLINVPYYTLSSGYEVYSVGLFDNNELGIEDGDLPPLLWRTKTKSSFIFVVNSDIFRGSALLGILTGFMANVNECYLYPIVNSQTISLTNYPYFSEENETNIEQIYSRGSEALSRDILWPNIVQVLKNYGNSFNFFAASQLDYMDEVDSNSDYISFYLKEINKLPGEMELSLDQVSEAGIMDVIDMNYSFFEKNIPEYDFAALFPGDFKIDEIKGVLDHDLLKNVTLIMDDYSPGDNLIDFVNNDVLLIKFNLDGYRHETLDDLQMKTTYNVLGMCNMKVDIKKVIYPGGPYDEWNNLSLIWSRGDTYFKDYSQFDMVSIHEMERRVRRFLVLDYSYEYSDDENYIDIQIKNFDKEAYFILSVYDKNIISIDNGESKKLGKDTFLIKAMGTNLKIKLKDNNILESPTNNIIIPYDPEARYIKED